MIYPAELHAQIKVVVIVQCANKYVQISNSTYVPGSQLVNYN